MHGHKMLKQVQKVEHVGRISRQLSMLLAFMVIKTFVNTAKISCCDRRTVAMWYYRFACAAKSFQGIRQALSDKPRSGRPPKIDRKILNKARHWCEERAFTPVELHDKLEEMSGKNLGISQIRRYARQWGYSRKKTQPIMVSRTPIEEVNKWRASLYQKIARYTKMGYTIVTQDESHFNDAAMSAKYWAKLCLRIFMLWSGGFHRFSMICSMTQDGRQFFNHCQTLNTTSFLEHGQGVQRGRQDGPDTRQGTVAHIQGDEKILCRARHYCPVVSYRTSISESRRGSMERTLTRNESFHTLCRQGCTSGSSV